MKPPMDHKIKRPFAWVKPEATDVGKTFARERARLKALEESRPQNVRQLKGRKN